MITWAGLFTLIFATFAVCRKISFKESEALLKRQAAQISNQTDVVYLPDYPCQPTLVPMEVPLQMVFPTYVKLSRCMGGVFSVGSPLECAVDKEETLRLSVEFFNPNRFGYVLMTNHTKCKAKCFKNLKQACNTTTHKFDSSTCECNCRDDYDQCGPGMIWDKTYCKCICKQIQACTGQEAIKIWSNKVCKCVCQDILVLKCKASGNGKVLRPDTCDCVCPPKLCPKGKVVDPRDCKCKI